MNYTNWELMQLKKAEAEKERLKAQKAHGIYDEVGEKLKAQLDHHFYKAAEKFRDGIKMETMEKAAEKYNEPFDPSSWTNEELAKHAMAENYDQTNYIYGMYERMQKQEEEIAHLKKEVSLCNEMTEFWRLRCIGEADRNKTTVVKIKSVREEDMEKLRQSISELGGNAF